jgi:hypothetical protein
LCHTEFVKTKKEDWFVDLESKGFGLDERQRLSVNLDETLSLFAVSHGCI